MGTNEGGDPILGRWATPPAGVTLEIRGARGSWAALTFATRDDTRAGLLLELLADAPARSLSELVIGEIGTNHRSYDAYLEQLPSTLVRVHVGKHVLSTSSTYATWSRATLPPNVHDVVFECIVHDLDGLPSQHLERLVFREYTTNANAIRRVFAARPFPALRELEVVVDDNHWSNGSGSILDGTRQPALRRLTVHEAGHWIVGAIARSGILRQLEVLELANGTIENEAAETLAACPDLDSLKTLDLTGNRLSDRVLDRFRGRPFALRGDNQRFSQSGE